METKTLDIPLDIPPEEQCPRCVDWLRDALKEMEGVQAAEVDVARERLVLTYDPRVTSVENVSRRVRELGIEVQERFRHETFTITEIDCADCATKLEKAISRLPGVVYVSVNFAASKLYVEYQPSQVRREEIINRIESLGYGVAEVISSPRVERSVFRISGLDCADCAARVERAVSRVRGVRHAALNFPLARLTVEHDPAQVTPETIVGAVEQAGYGAVLEEAELTREVGEVERPFWHSRRVLTTAVATVAALTGLALVLVGAASEATIFYALAIIASGFPIARSGLTALRAGALDMNFLMTLAVIGAAAIGEWAEGAAIVVLFSIGATLQSYTMDRARRAIRTLMAVAPEQARVRRAGTVVTLPVDQVSVGDVVVVRPGERIPMDGRVVDGFSSVNQASITGESVPVEKGPGDPVFAGTINERGYLEIEVTKPYQETTIAKIIHMVEEAQARRAPSQQFVDTFARYYTPAVIATAAGLAIIPWLFFGQPFTIWLYRGLVLLVIACPCALVVSTPVAIVAGIANAARSGILVKGGAYLEAAGRLRAVAFDKTGTLTMGKPEVIDVVPLGGHTAEEVLSLAAAVESRSVHPLAAAILHRARHAALNLQEVRDFEVMTSRGASARLNGNTYYVGSLRFLKEVGAPVKEVEERVQLLQSEGRTVLLVGTKDEIAGLLVVADRLRDTALEAVNELRQAGIEEIVMLTGDHAETAKAIAWELGLNEYRAELLPEDKVQVVQDLLRRFGQVAMVGDGVNDAPALAASTVGIAMGAIGSDVALETADVALMSDDLTKIPYLMRLGKATLETTQQNIVISLLVKGIFLALAATGIITLWMAVVADVGTTLIVILNGMRLLRRGI